MNAFDGVVGLTVSTRDVLLGHGAGGRRGSDLQSSAEVENKGEEEMPALYPIEKPLKARKAGKRSPHSEAGSEASAGLGKYRRGFDELSEMDEHSEAADAADGEGEGEGGGREADCYEESMDDAAGAEREDLRRRKPQTRSRTRVHA